MNRLVCVLLISTRFLLLYRERYLVKMSPPSKNTRSKEDSDQGSSATTLLSPTSLPKDTPPWGISLFVLLSNFITSLETKITDLTTSLHTSIDISNTAHNLAQENKNTIDSLTSKVQHLSEAVEFLLTENKKQKDHIIKNETYSRRDNLIFRGFTISQENTNGCDKIIRDIIRSMGIPNADQIPFVRCHYLREQKQIIVRFQWFADRERVWTNRYKLKNTNFYVSEDFPQAIESQRKLLYPVFKAARTHSDYQRQVTMRGNRLIIKGRHYTPETLDQVPIDVHPRRLAERSSDSVLVFGGATSCHHNLSNFKVLQKNFVYEQFQYSSSEQAFQHKKARQAGDQNIQREIMFNTDPAVQKSCGHRVRGLDETSWNRDRRAIMKDILIAKFTQDEDSRKTLKDTGDRVLAEANGRDNYFGIGMPLTHPDVLNTEKWSENGNQLGQILMEIRQLLRE